MTDKKKVLIVEDDEDIRLGMRVLLSRDYETCFAEDGISAMTTTRRERPDIILLDLGLPGGDGLTVLKWLREIPEFSIIPVFVVTGRDSEQVEMSALAMGATMVFHKPADPTELSDAIRAALEHSVGKPRKTVLVVDDDQDTRTALGIRLQANDYATVFAADGAGALAAAREHRPDAILLDLGLPGGDGFTVLERLKALDNLAHIPVIVLTGRDVDANFESAINRGAVAFLQKPCDPSIILDAIAETTRAHA